MMNKCRSQKNNLRAKKKKQWILIQIEVYECNNDVVKPASESGFMLIEMRLRCYLRDVCS